VTVNGLPHPALCADWEVSPDFTKQSFRWLGEVLTVMHQALEVFLARFQHPQVIRPVNVSISVGQNVRRN
jgi:hypothetical protein